MQWLNTDHGFNTYITIFCLLILGGFGFPIPEDIPLVVAGVAAARGAVSFELVLAVCYIGVVLADIIIYGVGHCYGQRVISWGVESPFFPSLTEERVEAIRHGLRRRRLLYIFLGRHVFPVRTATFLTAGSVGIPFLEFLVADAFAALVSVSIVVGLGYWLGGSLSPEVISHFVHQSNFYLAGVILLILISYFAGVRWKKRHGHHHETTETSAPTQLASPLSAQQTEEPLNSATKAL